MLFRFQSNIYFYRQPKLVAFVVLTVLTVFNIYDNLRRVLLSYLSVFFQTIFFLRCCLINIHKKFRRRCGVGGSKSFTVPIFMGAPSRKINEGIYKKHRHFLIVPSPYLPSFQNATVYSEFQTTAVNSYNCSKFTQNLVSNQCRLTEIHWLVLVSSCGA